MSERPPRPPTPIGMRLAVALPLTLVAASLLSLELVPGALFGPGAWSRLVEFAAGFLPPTHDVAFLSRIGDAALETLAMSLVGTLLAAVVALPLAAFAARPRDRSRRREHGNARRAARHAPLLLARATTRAAFVALRSVPDLVWAALLIVLVGIGPASGTLALAFYTCGVLGRLYAEAIEESSDEVERALRTNGASGWQAFVHGRLPLALPSLLAWTLYRWEHSIRAAALLGLVGAGGLGQSLHVSLGLFRLHDAAGVIITMLALVALVDATSFRLRRALLR